MKNNTLRLFKMIPCFFVGMLSALDIGATTNIYNWNNTPNEADYEAITSDWQAVGMDIRSSLHSYNMGLNNECK